MSGAVRGIWRAIWNGLLLRCPRCGGGRIFRTRWEMHPRCPACGLGFERAEGDFLGAIVVAYGVTSVLIAAGAYALAALTDLPGDLQVAIWAAVGTLFLFLFYRNMKGIWIGILYLMTGRSGSSG
ncbi:MAG: DUF983 domain-containing protein [Bacillota bacterium]